jgi:hypothetical protein
MAFFCVYFKELNCYPKSALWVTRAVGFVNSLFVLVAPAMLCQKAKKY